MAGATAACCRHSRGLRWVHPVAPCQGHPTAWWSWASARWFRSLGSLATFAVIFPLTKFPTGKRGQVQRGLRCSFCSLALQVLLKTSFLFFQHFHRAPVAVPVVPAHRGLGRAPPMVFHLQGEENSPHQRCSQYVCEKPGMSTLLPCHISVSSYFTQRRKRERREITVSARNVSNTSNQWVTKAGCLLKEGSNKMQSRTRKDKTWLKANLNVSCCKFGGRNAVPSLLPYHSHTQNNLKLVVKKINCRESPWRALAASISH